jgi:hypothetical protein
LVGAVDDRLAEDGAAGAPGLPSAVNPFEHPPASTNVNIRIPAANEYLLIYPPPER